MNYTPSEHIISPDIVFLVPTLSGGIGTFTSRLAQGFQEENMRVEVWTLTHEERAVEIPTGIVVRTLKARRALTALKEIRSLLKQYRPRTLLSSSFHINCIAVVAKSISQAPTRIFLVEHTNIAQGLQGVFKRLLARICIRLLYPRANGVIAVSEGVADNLASFSHIPRKSIHVIYNPVITDELYTKSKEHAEHSFFQLKEPLFLNIGRLSPEKDQATLLKAFAQLLKKTPARLIILGEGTERAALETLIATLGIREFVSLEGHKENPYPYFLQSDALILSSTREGLPTVLIEALALGAPIVSTDAESGPREILNNGLYGELVPTGDTAALAKSMQSVLTTPSKKIESDKLSLYTLEHVMKLYARTFSL